MAQESNTRYVVRDIVAETPGVSTLRLSLVNGSIPKYVPGQFITVYAPELGTPEGKAYSISSAPHEKTLDITVKDMGKFSHYLCSRKQGDELEGSLPYGYFFSESRTSTLALVCGGIGIAPMRSMLIAAARETPRRNVALFYSNRTAQDIVFKKTLDELGEDTKNIKIFHFLTREHADPPAINGRINAKTILESLGDAQPAEFLLCGSISFVRDLWRDLRAAGVPEEKIYTEAFFSH
mgnify:FL=1